MIKKDILQLELGLNSNSTTNPLNKVISSPLIYVTLIDNYLRREKEEEIAIGALLGTRLESNNKTIIKVLNCYPIPHSESKDELELDVEYHKIMLDLCKKISPVEELVGWYSVGNRSSKYTNIIHDFFFCQINPNVTNPAPNSNKLSKDCIYLNFGINADDNPFQIDFYNNASISLNNPLNFILLPVSHEVQMSSSEKTGMDILCSIEQFNVSTNKIDIVNLKECITKLKSDIKKVKDYVAKVMDNKLAKDEYYTDSFGRYLINTLSLVPKFNKTEVEELFNSHLQDILMVSYLTNTTLTQLQIAKNLQNWHSQ